MKMVYTAAYLNAGSPDGLLEERRIRDRKVAAGAAGEISFPELTLRGDSYWVSVSSPCYRSAT